MPKRIVDGEALWRSKKLKSVKKEYRAEYANLIPLAEANGSFDADPERVWADVYSFNRPDVDVKTVVRILDEFEKAEMLQRWEEKGKTWGYWNGINKSGRLPVEAHLERYKHLPPDCPGLSRTVPEEAGIIPKGLGSGSGIGIGVVKDVNLVKELPRLCRQILGIRPERADFQVWGEIKELAKAYGSRPVMDAFEEWANANRGKAMAYPVSEFVRMADGLLGGIIELKKSPALQALLDQIAVESSNDIVFSPEQIPVISKLFTEHGQDLVLAAFRDFYSRIEDDFSRKRAAKDFTEKAGQFIRTLLARQEEESKTKQLLEASRRQLEETAPSPETEQDAKEALEALK